MTRLYRQISIVAIIVILSCNTSFPASSKSAGNTSSVNNANTTVSEFEQDILFHINQYRHSLGKASLQMNTAIAKEATKHSTNMAMRRTPFSHNGFQQRISQINSELGGVSASAENVAEGRMSAKEVVATWLKSAGHKKNIQGNYNLTGIGTATSSNGTIYFTQIFILKQ